MRTGVQEQIALILSNNLELSADQNCSNFFSKTTWNLTAEMKQISFDVNPELFLPKADKKYSSYLSTICKSQSLQIASNKNQHSYLLFAPRSINNKPVSVSFKQILAFKKTPNIKISN